MHQLSSRIRRSVLAISSAGVLAAGMAVGVATPAAADYGNQAVYQIEISANFTSPDGGFGVWLWIELNADGTGDYAGSDCGHTPGVEAGAISDRGDVTWTSSNGILTIHDVGLFGGALPVTFTLPAGYGHYYYAPGTLYQVVGFPVPGWAQVQIAP